MGIEFAGAGAIFRANPEAVAHLVTDIHRGKLAIPNFQRDFVWEPDNSVKLLSSILAHYPAGSLLFWQAPAGELDPRPVAGAPELDQSQVEQLILDGQQRLTALYRVLAGVTEERYFLDLAQLIKRDTLQAIPDEQVNWDTVVSFEQPTAAQKRKKETPGYQSAEWQYENWKFPIDQTAKFDDWMDAFLKKLPSGQHDAAQAVLRSVRDKHIRPLTQYHFPVITLVRETSLTAVCRIFETLNSTGEPLGPFELLTARFMHRGVNLRLLLEQSQNDHPMVFSADTGFGVDSYNLLQVVSLRALNSAQRHSIMNDLTADHVREHWNKAVDGMEAAIELLRDDCGVLIKEWLPYTMVLVPMAAVWEKVESATGVEKARRRHKLIRYFWSTVFTANFDQGANSQAQADYISLNTWLTDDTAKPPEAIGELPISAESLLTATVKRRSLFRAVIALTLANGAKDFHTTEKLNSSRIREDKIDAHHLFPKKAFEDGVANDGLSPELILNRALIDAATNRRIGKKKPSTYLGEMEPARVADIMESHLVAEAPMREDSYRKFVHARLTLVVEAIERATEKKVVKAEPDAVSPDAAVAHPAAMRAATSDHDAT